jgi:hypothetical protein
MPEYEALFFWETGGGDKKIRDKKVSLWARKQQALGIVSEIQVKLFRIRE